MTSFIFKEAHAAGLCDVAYLETSASSHCLVTCGKDGKLCFRNADLSTPPTTIAAQAEGDASPAPLTAIAVAASTGKIAVADESNFVKVYKHPSGELDTTATRFTLPPRALAYSPSASTLAAGGDDEGIKLIDTATNKVFRSLQAQPYTRGLAYDPEGIYLASLHANGALRVWDIATGKPKVSVQEGCAKIDPAAAVRLTPAWHPDGGSVLACPGADGTILLHERLSWFPVGELTGQHTGAVHLVAFSKNGLYLASTGEDQCVVVWDVAARTMIDKKVLPGAATGLTWHPRDNALAVITEDGEVGVWQGPVPASLIGPTADVDALAGVKKRGESLFDDQAADVGSQGGEESEDDYDREDSFLAESPGGQQRRAVPSARRKRRSRAGQGVSGRDYLPRGATAMDLMPAPQAPLQPGSTQLDAGRRYLAYTSLGCITLRSEADHNVVEVAFHDTARARRRVPLLNDFFGFTLGALGDRGALYASRSGPEAPSTLVYRPYDSWADNTGWTLGLPAGEEAECIAAGASFCAAATSKRALRLFSQAGLQTAVLTLPGAVVALAARHSCLAVAWHAAAPSPGGEQFMHYAVHDVAEQRMLHSGPLPLSAGSSLAWLGFSEHGQLACYDSEGELRLRSPDFGGAWVPAFSSAAERKGAERFWLFSVAADEAFCLVCANQPEPTVPSGGARPVVSAVPLRIPVAQHDESVSPLEAALLRHNLALAHATAGPAGDEVEADALEAAARAAQVEADRAGLRLFAKLVQGDRQARALEVAAALHTMTALQGAMKMANHQRAATLADHVAGMIERRMALEAEAEAVEAGQAAAQQGGGYWAAEAASPAITAAAPVFPRESPAEPAEPAGQLDSAGKVRVNPFARKPSAADTGLRTENGSPNPGGAPGSQGAAAKRKAPVGNPFARKKAGKA